MVVRRGAYTVFWLGNLNEGDHLEFVGVDGRIILKWIFRTWDGKGRAMCTKPSGFLKCAEFLD
jgi:hypothetical protein